MSSKKKLITIISEFPKILFMITRQLRDEEEDYILDASSHTHPEALIMITSPDAILLNLKLTRSEAIALIGSEMQNSLAINRSMIISNVETFYMSLCKTFSADYILDEYLDLRLIPEAVSKQQLN